jgi:hypothetical protein
MSFRFVEHILVEVHLAADPSDAEWDAFLDTGNDWMKGGELHGCLVLTEGGSPNAKQRKKMVDIPGVTEKPVAVVTHSLVARGAVTALSWLGHKIRSFAPDELDDAMSYATVSQAVRPKITETIASMKFELAGSSLADTARDLSSNDVAALMEKVAKERMANVRARVDKIQKRT